MMKNKVTDAAIVQGCLQNDRRAQEKLYRRHFEPMMRMCMRYTKDPETAITIVNDGFLKVFKNMHKYEERGHIKSWIQKIVFRSLSDHFRKKSTRDLQFLVLDDGSDSVSNDMALPNLYMEDLMLLINDLPEKQRDVFTLFAVEGYTHKEIADQLDINVNTSKWYLTKAREELKQKLRQNSVCKKENGA